LDFGPVDFISVNGDVNEDMVVGAGGAAPGDRCASRLPRSVLRPGKLHPCTGAATGVQWEWKGEGALTSVPADKAASQRASQRREFHPPTRDTARPDALLDDQASTTRVLAIKPRNGAPAVLAAGAAVARSGCCIFRHPGSLAPILRGGDWARSTARAPGVGYSQTCCRTPRMLKKRWAPFLLRPAGGSSTHGVTA